MLKINHILGASINLDLDPSELTGDLITDQTSDYIKALKAGTPVTVGADGFVALADDASTFVGLLVNDASGYTMENAPALASLKVAVLAGGAIVETDNVVDDDIAAGDLLYADAGVITKVAPGLESTVIGLAMTANSAADKTVRIKVQ